MLRTRKVVTGNHGRRTPSSTPWSGIRRAQHPKVAAAGDLHRVRRARAAASGFGRTFVRTRGFPYGVGERFEVVTAGAGGRGGVGEPHHFPAARRGQPLTVLSTEVVAVGLGIGGERAEDRSRVGIDVRQCRDGRAAARGARTATYRAHDVGRYRTLERAATTLPQVTPPCRTVTSGTTAFRATTLTCTGREKRRSQRQRFRLSLDTKAVIRYEISDRGQGLKRAQRWPECSTVDMPLPCR